MIHTDEPSFHIQCNLQGCQRTFRKFGMFRNHVYSVHDMSEQSGDMEEPSQSEKDAESREQNTYGIIENNVSSSVVQLDTGNKEKGLCFVVNQYINNYYNYIIIINCWG